MSASKDQLDHLDHVAVGVMAANTGMTVPQGGQTGAVNSHYKHIDLLLSIY